MQSWMMLCARTIGFAAAAGAFGAAAIPPAFAAPADDAEAQARATWREAIVHVAAPQQGCFHASYPSTVWSSVDCRVAPDRRYLPRRGPAAQVVGNGTDYAAEVSGLLSQTVGTFPTVTGVTSEKDDGESNDYSLQLNSNFMSTAACNGVSGCLSWEQFVYSSGEEAAFMQYWLIDYGDTCPDSSWISYSGSCYKNSAAVSVPKLAISQLAYLKMSASAVSGGSDTLVFTTETEAYSTTGADSVVDLATDWNESEFNIVGDGGGSEAKFNSSGVSITVKIATTDGSTAAPSCASDAGTTGETNNLTLGSCSGTGGSAPYIEFTESN